MVKNLPKERDPKIAEFKRKQITQIKGKIDLILRLIEKGDFEGQPVPDIIEILLSASPYSRYLKAWHFFVEKDEEKQLKLQKETGELKKISEKKSIPDDEKKSPFYVNNVRFERINVRNYQTLLPPNIEPIKMSYIDCTTLNGVEHKLEKPVKIKYFLRRHKMEAELIAYNNNPYSGKPALGPIQTDLSKTKESSLEKILARINPQYAATFLSSLEYNTRIHSKVALVIDHLKLIERRKNDERRRIEQEEKRRKDMERLRVMKERQKTSYSTRQPVENLPRHLKDIIYQIRLVRQELRACDKKLENLERLILYNPQLYKMY
jgi:hypothetical protein